MQDPSQSMLHFGNALPPMHPAHAALLQAHAMHMPALPMRRTRSRTSSTDSMLAIPPALPLQESLSEAALAIGLEMEEATRQLMQDEGLPIRRSRSRGPSQLSTSYVGSAPQATGRMTMGQHSYCSGFAQSEDIPPPSMPPTLPSAPAPTLPPAPVLQPSLSKVLEGLDGPGSPLLGSPMRRTRSRGLGPLPMMHSISELVSSFISDGPGPNEERVADEDDILAGW